jgi:transmembrane sensor
MSCRHRGKNLVRWAAVAVMIICIAVATLWGPSIFQTLASDYHIGKGGQWQVTLADGSHIFLNTNSAISMNISAHQRRFTLLRGEAYFAIVADTGRPAVVISHRGETQVVGTAFNVAQRGEDTVDTTATQDIENGVQDFPDRMASRPRTRLRTRQVRLQMAPLGISDIG